VKEAKEKERERRKWKPEAPKRRVKKSERRESEEMEAGGAQKLGRMEKNGGDGIGAKESQDEKWATQDVKRVQEALKNKGHNPGSMDGVISPHTRQAIKAFQSANGLKATSRLDSETTEKLGRRKKALPLDGRTAAKEAAAKQEEPSSPMSK
jgi:Putative peptidoglycan binding domain